MIKYKNNPFEKQLARRLSKEIYKDLKKEYDKKLEDIQAEYNKNIEVVRADAIETYTLICLESLKTEFGFGDKRLKRFLDKMNDVADSINNDYISKADLMAEFQ